MKINVVVSMVLFLAVLVPSAHGNTVVFDNFPASGGGIGVPGGWFQAQGFSPSSSGPLSQITLLIGTANGTANATVQLRDDNSGSPGSVLETFLVPIALWGLVGPTTLDSDTNPELLWTQMYWVSVTSDAAFFWSDTASMTTGDFQVSSDGASWAPPAGFLDIQRVLRVETATPEPGTVSLILLGGIVLIARRWRRAD